ncbi:MAG: polysaccharide biosynthesis/export family protein [Acidobacteriota bacterium]|nr:polysaccharide biosynthesis/export family protein [Acidobacteriota bacterium]
MKFTFFALAVALIAGPPGGICQEAISNDSDYQVGIGDVIDVETFSHEDISGEFTVQPSGVIVFPLLGGVSVAGKTPADVGALLESLLEKDYYVDVQLKVEMKVFASQPVTVLGEIQKPGTYYLEGRTSLTDLLAKAGGLKPTAGPTLELRRVTRVNGEGPPPPMIFATSEILTGERGRDVFLEAGDVLSVAAKKLYFITGEVARPGQYEITLGMTLMQALSQAGGVGKFASQSLEVHRLVNGEKEILSFDLAHIRKGRVEDPPIEAGDVIYVKRRFF